MTFGEKKRSPEDFLANEELELFSVFLPSSSENKRVHSVQSAVLYVLYACLTHTLFPTHTHSASCERSL